MRRRRRQADDIAFGFDSFLDVVANVVGIIIRFILVVWVAARSYSSLRPPDPPRPAEAAEAVRADPAAEKEVEQLRDRLAALQAQLLRELGQVEAARQGRAEVEGRLASLAPRRRQVEEERAALDRQAAAGSAAVATAGLSLEELRQRSEKLAEAIKSLQAAPVARKTLRYRTPVSRPVQADEYHFECKGGRVAFIDVAALLAEVRRGLEDKGQVLRSQWRVNDTAGPVGAFRLKYVVERERGAFDVLAGGGSPDAAGSFRYGVSSWEVEPISLVRGEPRGQALAPGSEFRRVTDALDPRQATVTFWVYPDSFALFRELRDHLHDRDVVVAGRPLPDGVAIASSRQGTASRGQ